MRTATAILVLLAVLLLPGLCFSKPVIAFGYLRNVSGRNSYNYVETIFPASFASSIATVYDVETLKPHQVNARLRKHKTTLKLEYEDVDLPGLADKIKADMFICGQFEPLEGNRIRISLNLYDKKNDEMLAITDVGRMETQIYRIVDRITVMVLNFVNRDRILRLVAIPPGKRIAFLTNLDGAELNSLYAAFMGKGYPVTSFQNTELINRLSDADIDRFKYIRTRENSYYRVDDWRKAALRSGTWSTTDNIDENARARRIYRDYFTDFSFRHSEMIERLSKAYGNTVDYVMIIGFNAGRSSAWMRCVDVKERNLVMMQSNIKSGAGDPVVSISEKILETINMPMRNPFEEKAKLTSN